MPRPIVDLELTVRGAGPVYRLDAELRDSMSAGYTRLLADAPLPIYWEALRAVEHEPLTYGRMLGAALSQDRSVWQTASDFATGRQATLRLRLRIADEARALHALRWECLCTPQGEPVVADGRVPLLRYVPTENLDPVATPAHDALRALIAVASPSDSLSYNLPPFDAPAEHARVAQALADAPWLTVLAPDAPNGRATTDSLREMLGRGCDVLYLTCHGTLAGNQPVLWLENDQGEAERLPGADLERMLRGLEQDRRPLLVILASCHGAGSGDPLGAIAALGPQLARAGVPAVVALQGLASLDLVASFMPVLLRELFQHGSIDLAVAAARAGLYPEGDWWVPVVYTRVEDGRLWQPGPPPPAHAITVYLDTDDHGAARVDELRQLLALRGLCTQTARSAAAGAELSLLYVNQERLEERDGASLRRSVEELDARAAGHPVLLVHDTVSLRELRPVLRPADLGWEALASTPSAEDSSGLGAVADKALRLALAGSGAARIRGGALAVELTTFEPRRLPVPPALLLDWWTAHYRGGNYPPPEVWNAQFLPALAGVLGALKDNGVRQINLSGNYRLSAGLAFGYAFREVTKFSLRVNQGPNVWWRTATHDPAARPFGDPTPTEVNDGPNLSVELNITSTPGKLSADVDNYIAKNKLQLGKRLRLELLGGPNPRLSEADAQAIASQVRTLLQTHWRPREEDECIHLFMAAPKALAVLIGWHLNMLTPVQAYDLAEGENRYIEACKLVKLS